MPRPALSLALFLWPYVALAGPTDGFYRNAAGPSLEIQGATEQGFDFGLTSEGGTACPEAVVDCLHVGGHADLQGKFYTYVDPDDDTSRIFFAVSEAGVKVVSTTGPLGTGTGNRAAMVTLPGLYTPDAVGDAGDLAPADQATRANAFSAQQLDFFRSPTGNIACLFVYDARMGEVRCDLLQLNRSFTRAPVDCDLDWGDSFSVASGDRKGSLTCHGDTVSDPGAQVLDYGSTLSHGDVACQSDKSGMTCQNAGGHGFTVSRRQQALF